MGQVNPEYARKVLAAKQISGAAYARGGTEGLREELASLRRLDADPVIIAEVERTYHRAVKYDAQIAANKAAENDPEQMSHAQLYALTQRQVRREERSRALHEQERARAPQPAPRRRAAQELLSIEETGFRLLHPPGTVSSGVGRRPERSSCSTRQRGLFDDPELLELGPVAAAPQPAPQPALEPAPERKRKASKSTKKNDARQLAIVRSAPWKAWQTQLRATQKAMEKRARDELEAPKLFAQFDRLDRAYDNLRALPLEAAELEEEYQRKVDLRQRIASIENDRYAHLEQARRAELERIDEEERSDPSVRYVPGVGYVQGKRALR